MQTKDKINSMWKQGLSIKEIVKKNGLPLEVPENILVFTKDTPVCLEKENGNILGKIVFWDCEYCVLEYMWNGIPIKRRINKEEMCNLRDVSK